MTEADFFAAQRAFMRTRGWLKVSVGICALAGAFVLFAAVSTVLARGLTGLLDLLPMLLIVGLWSWLIYGYFWGAPLGSRRYFRQSQLHKRLEYEWDDAAISVRGPDIFQRVAWADVLRWAESRDSLVIVITDRSYVPIPKRFFAAQTLDDLRDRLVKVRRA